MIKLNGIPIQPTIFPDNTSQVWKLDRDVLNSTNFALITWAYEHEGEFMHLAQLKALLDDSGIEAALKLPYLPYARQDKLVSNNTTFALRVFAKHLNLLNFKSVIIHDPHSSVALSEIARAQLKFASIDLKDIDLYCYPDAGAEKKYTNVYTKGYVYGEKVRNQSTGNIESYRLYGNVLDKNVLIVDDICDGGATFVLLAQALRNEGAKSIKLFVTHGIFSKGVKHLKAAGISEIYTCDEFLNLTLKQ
jgi:ribose-phosphate pyrophosphokinase